MTIATAERRSAAPGVARVILYLGSVALGGMERHCLDLAGEFRRRGLTVGVILPDEPLFDGLTRDFAAHGCTTWRLTADDRDGRRVQVKGLRRLKSVLGQFHPDVVHMHLGGATSGLSVLLVSQVLSRCPTVITEHDVPAERISFAHRVSRKIFDRVVNTVVAVSGRNAGIRRERLGSPDRSVVVYNGVPIPAFCAGEQERNRALVRSRHGIPESAFLAGSIVRLAAGKGLETLIPAFARFHAAKPESRLILVGDGPLRESIEARCRDLGISGHVIFAGHQADTAPYYDALDAFVLAVPAGSMSIALLEAMSRGIPPIITFGGPEEAVVDGVTGLAVPPNDECLLADAIGSLAADPIRRLQIARQAREHVERHYSVARVADDLLREYELAAKRPSSRT